MTRVEVPHLDVMVCTACNLKCIGCTNFMGAIPMELWPVEQIMRDVHHAARVMHAEQACLLGGEPTAHPKLVQIMREVQASGLADHVQVLTNGTRLHLMKPDFWGSLDRLKVSIYPGKTQPANITLAQRMAAEHGFTLEFYDVKGDPFRAVLTREAKTPEQAQQTYDGCWYRTYTRKIEQGHLYRCCTSPQISQTILGLDPGVDGIRLDGLTTEALAEYLARPTAMQSCTRCHGHLGPRLPVWTEERDTKRWLELSAVPH